MLWNRQSIVALDKLSPFNGGRKAYHVPSFLGGRSRLTAVRLLVVVWVCISLYWLLRARPSASVFDSLSDAVGDGAVVALDDANHQFDMYLNALRQPVPDAQADTFDPRRLVHSTVYDTMLATVGLPRILLTFGLQDRCDLYFKLLYLKDPNWRIDPGYDYAFDRSVYDTEAKFKAKMGDKYREEEGKAQEKDPKDIEVPAAKMEDFGRQYRELCQRVRREEQMMHDAVSHIKIFNQCYANSTIAPSERYALDAGFVRQQNIDLGALGLNHLRTAPPAAAEVAGLAAAFDSCRDLELRVYPWLTGVVPTYTRWDGTTMTTVPQMCKYTKTKCSRRQPHTVKSPLTNHKPCFVASFKLQLNGQGIGLTINDGHVPTAIRLLRLLRLHHNVIPIEIIYNDAISPELRQQLVKAARLPLRDPATNQNLVEQELWFVDVLASLHESHRGRFGGFGNKILAMLFNSFAEFMLVDADTVLLQQPQYVFSLDRFKESGSLFYKDRTAIEMRGKDDLVLFRKLMPLVLDTAMFNIPQITQYTLGRDFFRGINHYMESGLVLVDRTRHFNQGLMMAQLNFMRPSRDRVYGDKELFWLAMVMYGDETYYFNRHNAAAIGEETPEIERVLNSKVGKKEFRSKEVCLNHPAHINDQDDHTLLWFNSGYQFCGQCDKVDFAKEFKEKARYLKHDTEAKFEAFFRDKLVIRDAVIPPGNMDLGLVAKNDEHEPDRGWINMRQYCNGYTWCAYSLIGGRLDVDRTDPSAKTLSLQEGHFIHFTVDETALFDRLGDMWMSPFDFRSKKQKQIDHEEALKKEKEKAEKEKEEREKKQKEETERLQKEEMEKAQETQ